MIDSAVILKPGNLCIKFVYSRKALFFFLYIIIEGIFTSSCRLEELGIVQNTSVYFLFFKFRNTFFYTACHPDQTFTPWWTLFLQRLSGCFHTYDGWSKFSGFSVWSETKTTGVKPSPVHRPNQAAVLWSERKRRSRSGSNWTAVWFLSSIVVKGSDLRTSGRKLRQATQKKGNKLAGKGCDMKRLFCCFPERMKERRYNRAGEQGHLKIKKLADKRATKQVFF